MLKTSQGRKRTQMAELLFRTLELWKLCPGVKLLFEYPPRGRETSSIQRKL